MKNTLLGTLTEAKNEVYVGYLMVLHYMETDKDLEMKAELLALVKTLERIQIELTEMIKEEDNSDN